MTKSRYKLFCHSNRPFHVNMNLDYTALHRRMIRNNHLLLLSLRLNILVFLFECHHHNQQNNHPSSTSRTKLDMDRHYSFQFEQIDQDKNQSPSLNKVSTLFLFQHHMFESMQTRESKCPMNLIAPHRTLVLNQNFI